MRKFSHFLIFLAAGWLPFAAASAGAQGNFGSVNIGSSATQTVTFTLSKAVTVGSIVVVTQGAAGLDFSNAGTGTCTAGTAYAAGSTCTVAVKFKPMHAGLRYGAARLKNASGAVLATSYIWGIGTGPQIAYGPGTATAITPMANGELLSGASGITVDAAGDLFIADEFHFRVVEVPAGGGSAIAIDPVVDFLAMNVIMGVAVDGAGNVFIADFSNNRLVRVPSDGNPATAIEMEVNDALTKPAGLAVDGAGDIYVVDGLNGRVVELPAGGGSPIAINPTVDGQGLGVNRYETVYPEGIAVDQAGDLFIADRVNNRVLEVPAGGGAATALATVVNGLPLTFPTGVAVDAAGDLFIADRGNSRVVEVPAGGGAATAIDPTVNGVSLNLVDGVALDGAGNLYISDVTDPGIPDRVVEMQGLKPPVASFPTVTAVGSVDAVDGTRVFSVQNIGNGALTFTDLSYPADFREGAGDTDPCGGGTSLSAGQSCDLNIEFAPLNDGPLSESVTLTDNALNAVGGTQSIRVTGTGIDPTTESLSATQLVFSSLKVGTTSASQSVTLTNTGGSPLAIASIAVAGANASSFIFANSCGKTVAVGASCTIHGHFTPNTAGELTAAVTITDTSIGSPRTITLAGEGFETTVSLSAHSLVFGVQSVETTSASQSVTLTNTGGQPLSIASIAVTGANASSFIFGNGCGTSLAAGTSCTIHGHFTPVAAGLMTAAVTITDDAAGSPQTITLTGMGGTPAEVSLSATSISFGPLEVGVQSASQSVTLTNTGGSALAITSIAVTGADAALFTFADSCGTSVAAGASCTIHGHFSPTTLGTFSTTIAIADNASDTPQTIAVTGTGATGPESSFSPTSLVFGTQKVGTTSAPQLVTLTNAGGSNLVIMTIAAISDDPEYDAMFVIENNCGTSLAAGASCTISVSFAPTVAWQVASYLRIYDSVSDESYVTLNGTGD